MNSSPAESDYIFRFDPPLEPVCFGGEMEIAGWMLHRGGKAINGLRLLVRRKLSRKETFRGRRKRNRPDIAAAYPALAEAGASGFLFELNLKRGRNHLTFQLLDHERRWQTFASASIKSIPLTSLASLGLTKTRSFVIDYLKQRLVTKGSEAPALSSSSPEKTQPSKIGRIDLFATSKSNLFMVEIGELVAAGFRELGCAAQVHLDGIPVEAPAPGTLQIVVAPHEYHLLFLTKMFSRPQVEALTRNVYLLCTEQPETGWFQGSLQWARHSLGVADINSVGVAAYRAQGLPARQLGLGYHPLLAHPDADSEPHAARPFDVTFLGSMTPRREKFIARHADFFAHHRSHLRLVPLEFAKTRATRSYLEPKRRNQLLAHSRILLNLHHGEQKYFEWHRVLLGLANGCCVISETCQGYGRLVPNEHFVMVGADEIMTACEYYLARPSECEKIARAGQLFAQTELRQAQQCSDFLCALNQPVSLVTSEGDLSHDQTAGPLPNELRRKISRRRRRLFVGTVAEDLRDLLGKAEPRPDQAPPPTSAARDTAIKRREEYRKRFQAQEEARARGEPVLQLHDSSTLTNPSDPVLSIVITLYNYAWHIEECVASLTAAAERFSPPLELLIINDASTDESLARAISLQAKSILPVRVVDKKFNTGLADARNLGLQLARGEYIFMMDADNLVYPVALTQLFDAITQGAHDAAYSLLCRFSGTPANPIGLLSYFDWDPQILVQYPYIDAMAMFRRQVLLDAGGYDNQLSQIGWFGWEDYDLWLRLAQRGSAVAFVPNTLCLYRHHETSMINTTNLFAPEMVRHFIDRYGGLLERFEARATAFGVPRAETGEVLCASN